ncbi:MULTISPECIES: tannase/feruloyl esterase family alpha/beta hydrolase [unclassified Simplicispira]|uniref:tannase/feruloyl esterase family alpha/beta hydrolase n=1 Tax=unclassified Simplicispira TaxID=2630407 RepID=UPI000D5D0B40|nr:MULTISPECIES: tannase/feruloyl esterase family alpha/beta hydrolase [unclassified Simplicispira]PVY57204.1 feruloyl esterase [Simplicispira sp. 125]REG18149.1 feruloyl esterase [Simplicispira sp. 110]
MPKKKILFATGYLAVLLATADRAHAQPQACAEMLAAAIPSTAIGLPSGDGKVTEVAVVPAAGSNASATPAHCRVTGTLAPVNPQAPAITFRLALPVAWNGKVMMFGGGGFDGMLPNVAGNVPAGPTDQPTPLGRGYATFGSDAGHQANASGSLDGRFLQNDEAVRNFGGEALKKTRDAALFLISRHYAQGKPQKAYFAGGSTGGREALSLAQRWPDDWDGIIAWYPAWNQLSAMLGGHRVSRALAQKGAYPNPAKRAVLHRAVLETCDLLDGVADGVVSNQTRCNARFDPTVARVAGSPLRCPNGIDAGDTCLSDAQIAALTTMNTAARFNFFLASGSTSYPGYNVWGASLGAAGGSSPVHPIETFLNLGTEQPAMPVPSGAPYITKQLDQMIKLGVTRDLAFDSLTLDPENPGPWASRLSAFSTMLDVGSDLTAFAARGGKLLLAHGVSDVLVSARATAQYYQRLQAQMGASRVDSFARYYEVPGYGHAVSTVFNATWDSLSALENWVEKGIAPKDQVTTDTVGVPGRKRPLCEYPTWPRYRGAGDVNAAESYGCSTDF